MVVLVWVSASVEVIGYTVSSTTYPHENTTNRNYHLFSMVDCCFVGSISARDTPTARENTVVNTPLCHRCEARCPADQISGSCYRHFSVIFTLGMELLSQTVARTISSNLPTKLFQCNFYFGLSCFFTPEYPSRWPSWPRIAAWLPPLSTRGGQATEVQSIVIHLYR